MWLGPGVQNADCVTRTVMLFLFQRLTFYGRS